jgi:hypothetical protein
VDATRRRGPRVATTLVLPGTLPGRLLLAAVVALAWASTFWFLILLANLLAGLALVIGVVTARRSAFRSAFSSPWWWLVWLATFISGSSVQAFVIVGLAKLVIPDSSWPSSTASLSGAGILLGPECFLLTLVCWLVLGVPRRAHAVGVDPAGEGTAKRVLVRLLTVTAAALTGCSVLLMHFANGPLSGVQFGQVLVGALFTVALLAPYYQGLARLAWTQEGLGLGKVCRSLRESWKTAVNEACAAVARSAREDPDAISHAGSPVGQAEASASAELVNQVVGPSAAAQEAS